MGRLDSILAEELRAGDRIVVDDLGLVHTPPATVLRVEHSQAGVFVRVDVQDGTYTPILMSPTSIIDVERI